jgi:hypothetical protein
MCGHFTRNYTWEQLHALYSLSARGSNLQARLMTRHNAKYISELKAETAADDRG